MKEKILAFCKHNTRSLVAFGLLAPVLAIAAIAVYADYSISAIFSAICISVREYVGGLCCLFLIALLLLICSKYGSIRLGGDDAKPEYSNFSWLSCLMMAGMGIGVLFYCQEPLFHQNSNPYFSHVWGDSEAVAYSLTLYNWTFNAWGLYAMLGLVLAYYHFNLGKKLKISSILPDRTPQWICAGVDILMALGIIAGLCTSLGLGVAQLCSGLNYVYGVAANPYLLMLLIGIVATWSVNSGLKRGVKWLSNATTSLAILLLVFVAIMAYVNLDVTNYLTYTGKGIKAFFVNYIWYNDFANKDSDAWAAAWPVFYQMWFAAWAAFVSVFVAKISKGRTIREFILGVLLLPSVATAVWFGVFGAVGTKISDVIFPVMQQDIASSLFLLLNQFSSGEFYMALSSIVMLIVCLFFITSSDSSSYVVATLLTSNEEPISHSKIAWSLIQCVASMLLFLCGGLAMVQIASVILGVLVITIILVGMILFLLKLKKYKL